VIAKKKQFYTGVALMVGFVVVLILFFSPLYGGKNGLDYLDNLYNTISKGSAYYIPKVKAEIGTYNGTSVSVTLNMADKTTAGQTAKLFQAGGAEVVFNEAQIKVTGDLGKILDNCLADADTMYHNEGEKVSGKYGYDERQALFNWWQAFKEMDKDLSKQKKFKETKLIGFVVQKAVETSYNYYRIEPQKITDRVGLVIFSLIFYVVYTIWYGFGILFMFEGWGLRLSH
jgi:hypothetical protein